MERALKVVVPWVLAAGIVWGGWYSGYDFWDPKSPSSPGQFQTYFDLFVPFFTVVIGLPLTVAAGSLVGRDRWRTVLGYAALAGATVWMAYMTSFVFFGGICMDPRDACITTWESRLAAPMVAIACLAVGFAIQIRRRTPA
jgi:hypothetical protein